MPWAKSLQNCWEKPKKSNPLVTAEQKIKKNAAFWSFLRTGEIDPYVYVAFDLKIPVRQMLQTPWRRLETGQFDRTASNQQPSFLAILHLRSFCHISKHGLKWATIQHRLSWWHNHSSAKQSTMREKCSKDTSTSLENRLIQPKHADLRKKIFSMCCYFS